MLLLSDINPQTLQTLKKKYQFTLKLDHKETSQSSVKTDCGKIQQKHCKDSHCTAYQIVKMIVGSLKGLCFSCERA